MSSFSKKIILIGFKILFSAFCIFYLINQFGDEFKSLHYSLKINWFFIICALFLFGLSQVVSVIRWQICCNCLGITEGNSKFDFALAKLYLIGLFCNNFLPSSLGGDFVRAYLLKKKYLHSRWIDCAGSVFVDRAFGVTILAWIGFIALFIIEKTNSLLSHSLLIGMGFIALACTITILVSLQLGNFVKLSKEELKEEEVEEDKKSFLESLKLKFIEFALSLNKIQSSKFAIFALLFSSLIIQVLVSFCLLCLCFGLGFKIKFLFIWIMNPLATLGSLFAPSISGLGVREGIYAYVFQALGFPASSGIILSLVWFSTLLIISLPGAFYMLNQKKIPSQIQINNQI